MRIQRIHYNKILTGPNWHNITRMATNIFDTEEGQGQNAAKRKRDERGNTLNIPQTFVTPAASASDLNQETLTLNGQSLIYYKTLRKIERGLLKANHHRDFLKSHVEKGTTPRGLQANITSQIPDISTAFQLKWEQAHLDFSTNLTIVLQEYWNTRYQTLEKEKTELISEVTTKCSAKEAQDIEGLLSKLTIKPPTKEKPKVGGSKSPRSRSPNLITPSTSRTNI